MSSNTEAAKPTSKSKIFLYAATALIAAIWVGVFATLAIFQPTLRTKALILAGGAGATELIVYAGAAWFGVNLFKAMRAKLRKARD